MRNAKHLWAKQLIGFFLVNDFVGWCVGCWYGDKIPFRGKYIDVKEAPIELSVKALLFWGLYESAERRMIHTWLRPDLATIELGASLGGISSQIALKLNPGVSFKMVEANPHLISNLRRTAALNASHLKWEVVHGAVSYAGQKDIAFHVAKSSLGSSLASGAMDPANVSVPTIQLSDLATQSDYQMICDIEGAEAEILKFDRLAACKQMIIELHRTTLDGVSLSIQDLAAQIQALGFKNRAQYGAVFVFARD